MKAFLGGVLAGAAVVTAAVFLALPPDAASPPLAETPESVEPRTQQGREPDPRPSSQTPRRERKHTRAAAAESAPAPAAFEPGTAVLGIGDAYRFGESRVSRSRAGADLVCLDIRHGASFSCPRGALPADLPLDDTGLPRSPAEVAALVENAPLDLPRRQAQLPEQLDARHPGVELVRAGSGKVYKVHLDKLVGNPDALERRVRIVYTEVPAVEGGGVVRAVIAGHPDAQPVTTRADIERIMAAGKAVPSDSFANFMNGQYRAVTDLPPDLVLNKKRFLVVDEPLGTSVTFKSRGAIYATRGLTRSGRITLDSYSAAAVEGELAGKVDVKSYAYVFSGGDVTGEVDVGSYATLVIDGDLRGTVKVRSYTDLLLRGRILGTLDVKGSCWSTFWFETYMTRGQLESLPGDFRQVTLHVRESDLAAGEYDDVGTWRKVIVGAPAWAKVGR